jgi:DNA-binding transcriptional ArsR family regulator
MAQKALTKQDEAICEVEFVDKQRVEAVRARIPQAQSLEALSEIFKVLGDPSRLRILAALQVRELCVCDIANLVGASISAVSHQLRILRNLKLVKHEKRGKMVYYSLDDDCIENLIREGLKHIEE